MYVEDHAEAIDLILHQGKIGETYAIGGDNEQKNLDLVYFLIKQVDKKLNRPVGTSLELIQFVSDRLGHDYRYAIDASKIKLELKWKPSTSFENGINNTIEHYI